MRSSILIFSISCLFMSSAQFFYCVGIFHIHSQALLLQGGNWPFVACVANTFSHCGARATTEKWRVASTVQLSGFRMWLRWERLPLSQLLLPSRCDCVVTFSFTAAQQWRSNWSECKKKGALTSRHGNRPSHGICHSKASAGIQVQQISKGRFPDSQP